MAANDWLLQDGRSILVEFETAAAEKAWGWFGNRSSGEGLEFDAAAAAWTEQAWLRGGQYVMAGEVAGAVNYTLTCDAGIYTYTGQAATLQVRHSLTCAAGAYTYTGQAATLQVVHSLSCATGSYAYSGQAATLSVVHSLACAVGAYTYTGNDATLTYVPSATAVNYTLACDAGSYSYTGNEAVLSYSTGTAEERNAGGWGDYSRHPYLRPIKQKEKEKYIEQQSVLEEQIAQIEIEIVFKDQRKIAALEKKLEALQEQLDQLKILNALIAEQEHINQQEEEEMIMLLLAA